MWQSIIAGAVVLAAAIYVFARLRRNLKPRPGQSCGCGCGTCGLGDTCNEASNTRPAPFILDPESDKKA